MVSKSSARGCEGARAGRYNSTAAAFVKVRNYCSLHQFLCESAGWPYCLTRSLWSLCPPSNDFIKPTQTLLVRKPALPNPKQQCHPNLICLCHVTLLARWPEKRGTGFESRVGLIFFSITKINYNSTFWGIYFIVFC